MTTNSYNRFSRSVLEGFNWTADDVRFLLFQSTYVFNKDHQFVSDVVASEVSGTGYARTALTGKTLTLDLTNDRTIADAADVVMSTLNTGAQLIGGAIVYRETGSGGTDAGRTLICSVDFTPVLAANGQPYNIAWNTLGLVIAQPV
jgi:hypothetical protein